MKSTATRRYAIALSLLLAFQINYSQAPGAITGATVWFDANNGLNTTLVSGNHQVNSWNNLGSFSFGTPNRLVAANWNAGSVPANSQYLLLKNTGTNSFNYNPVINWNTNTANVCFSTAAATTYGYTQLPVTTTTGSIFCVGNVSDVLVNMSSTQTSPSPANASRLNVGSRAGGMEWPLGGMGFNANSYNKNGVILSNGARLPNIFSEQIDINATSYSSVNRSQQTRPAATFNALPQKSGSTTFTWVFSLGSFPGYTYGTGNNMAEVIIYNTQLTQAQSQKIESYLAIKYGITLDPAGLASASVGYVNSSGNNIFSKGVDGTNLWNQVIGIARDSVSGGGTLVQRQSHQADDSTRIYLGTLAVNNISNTANFTNNVSSVVIGNNNGYLCGAKGSHITEHPATATYRLDREWKIQVTGSSAATVVPDNFNMDVQLSGCANWSIISSGSTVMSNIGILVNNTSDLTTGLFIPNYTPYGSSTLSLSLNSTTGMITVNNLNVALQKFLDPSNTLNVGLNATNTALYFTIAGFDAFVLPLQKFSFAAKLTASQKVNLQWNMAPEEEVSSYNIQRSSDGKNWEDISSVASLRNKRSYQFTDEAPMPGLSFYRIKIRETSGATKYSSIQEIKIRGNVFFVESVRPNPFTSDIQINVFLPKAGSIMAALIDADGKTVERLTIYGSKGSNSIRFNDLSSKPAGIYYAEIKYNDKRITKKLIKAGL